MSRNKMLSILVIVILIALSLSGCNQDKKVNDTGPTTIYETREGGLAGKDAGLIDASSPTSQTKTTPESTPTTAPATTESLTTATTTVEPTTTTIETTKAPTPSPKPTTAPAPTKAAPATTTAAPAPTKAATETTTTKEAPRSASSTTAATTAAPKPTVAPTPKPTAAPVSNLNTMPQVNPASFKDQIFNETNKERQAQGLPALKRASDISWQIADIRAKETATLFSHTRPDGSQFNAIFPAYGHPEIKLSGENILYSGCNCGDPRAYNEACTHHTARGQMDMWMNSPGHKANILRESFVSLAVGFYYGPNDSGMNAIHSVQFFFYD